MNNVLELSTTNPGIFKSQNTAPFTPIHAVGATISILGAATMLAGGPAWCGLFIVAGVLVIVIAMTDADATHAPVRSWISYLAEVSAWLRMEYGIAASADIVERLLEGRTYGVDYYGATPIISLVETTGGSLVVGANGTPLAPLTSLSTDD